MFRSLRVGCLSAALALGAGGGAALAENVMIVFDGSNSMWGQIDGTAKIEIAREAMDSLLGEWTADTPVGLMAYGHRRRGDCGDIETLLDPAPGAAAQIRAQVDGITPTGRTPLTDAVEQAAEALSYTDAPATVILISDGVESCERDPCALARTLERTGVGFTAHVVGFGLGGDADVASLACIAEETGGRFLPAADAATLGAAFGEIAVAVAAPEPAPAPEPEPQPEPEPIPQIAVTAPATALAGSAFDIAWAETRDGADYLTIVPVGADPDAIAQHIRARDDTSGTLQAPGETGLYEVRYVTNSSPRETAGFAPIEIVEPEVSVSAPATAQTGEAVPVSWTGAVDGADYITIVPIDADENLIGTHTRVRDDSEGTLKAPGEPGLYEVRYVLNEGRRTLARAPVEVVAASLTVEGPQTVLAGATFEIRWSATVDGSDYLTIVPADAEEGTIANHTRAREASEAQLTAPGEPGLYEIRYVLNEGRGTIASALVEVTEPSLSLTAPEGALGGAVFEVSWSGIVNGSDFVTVVLMGAEEREIGTHIRVREDMAGALTAPGAPGLYEVRYVLEEGRRVLARAMLEVSEAQVSLTGPDAVRAGSDVALSWVPTVNARDYLTIVPLGAEEGSIATHTRALDASEAVLKAPDAPGLYELRYVLKEDRRTLASAPLEVLAEDAPMENGASLSAPDVAAPGAVIQVGWTAEGESADRRVALAGAEQPLFTWISAEKVGAEAEIAVTMPEQPGMYELRFIDVANREILSRRMIEVR